MPRFKRGLVIGKFYPPHRGHKLLIDTAAAKCDEVTVIVCENASQRISGAQRASWLKRIHPGVRVLTIRDDDMDDDDSEAWAKATVALLGYVPDAVFTSEDYGDAYAMFMGCQHVSVDKERVRVPISATEVRKDPAAAADFLEPVVRAYFAKRVVVLGAESTGTTTLTKSLAAHYQTAWVPEYGRMYAEGKLSASGEGAIWRTDEFEVIARGQLALEDALAESARDVLICDTDALATSVWHERYLGVRAPEVERLARERSYDLHILTGDEIPFVQDGTRDGEHIRHDMHLRFLERLEEEGLPYLAVSGAPPQRLAAAVAAIDALPSRVI